MISMSYVCCIFQLRTICKLCNILWFNVLLFVVYFRYIQYVICYDFYVPCLFIPVWFDVCLNNWPRLLVNEYIYNDISIFSKSVKVLSCAVIYSLFIRCYLFSVSCGMSNKRIVLCRCEEMVKQFNVDYVPGGATQNTIRIAQVC